MIIQARHTLRQRLSRLRREDGITMIIVMGVMLVTSLMLVAAFTSSRGEVHLTSTDTNEKKAYYAAQAGINEYLYHLTQDSNYLSYCTSPSPANPALNEVGFTNHRVTIAGTAGEPTVEQYAIELLPAESAPVNDKKCDPSNLVESMIEQSGAETGTFRIKSVGFAGKSQRSIIATFKNLNFVNFVWFTKYETFDPVIYGPPYRSACEQFFATRPGSCKNNYFVTGETIEGPVHTEDHAGVCGEPIFGRSASDNIEFHAIGSNDEGYSKENECGGSANPKFVGTHIPPKEVKTLEPPPGDEELQHVVESGYEFKEKTEIVLEGNEMTVIHGGKTEQLPFPKNHLIYVAAGEGTCRTYSPYGPEPGYAGDSGCANVYVRGNYTESLTIAAQNDVIVKGSITGPGTGGVLLGLIANNFIRIYHPLSGARGTNPNECLSSTNSVEDLTEPTVDAAMLALKHALMVDNYDCGAASLGHLNIFGALAGYFSNGLTGVFAGSGTIIHGYPYNLKYDRRLLVEEPPHFLNPIRAAWQVQRETLAQQ